MGRNYKEKKQLNIKFDWYIYQRFKKFLNVLNKQNGKNYNVSFEDNEDFPIIPGLFYFRRSNAGGWYNIDRLNEHLYDEDGKIMN